MTVGAAGHDYWGSDRRRRKHGIATEARSISQMVPSSTPNWSGTPVLPPGDAFL